MVEDDDEGPLRRSRTAPGLEPGLEARFGGGGRLVERYGRAAVVRRDGVELLAPRGPAADAGLVGQLDDLLDARPA